MHLERVVLDSFVRACIITSLQAIQARTASGIPVLYVLRDV